MNASCSLIFCFSFNGMVFQISLPSILIAKLFSNLNCWLVFRSGFSRFRQWLFAIGREFSTFVRSSLNSARLRVLFVHVRYFFFKNGFLFFHFFSSCSFFSMVGIIVFFTLRFSANIFFFFALRFYRFQL
jgi:hypothetical protein